MLFSTFVLLATLRVATASPVVQVTDSHITLSMAKQYNFTEGSVNLAEADRSRALALIANAQSGGGDGNGTQNAATIGSIPTVNRIVTYTANVLIGTSTYILLIDTGSSNTWVGANGAYKKSSTSVATGRSISIDYGSGFFRGTEYLDRVAFSSPLFINSQSIGVATSSGGIPSPINGILGIGPKALTTNTFNPPRTIPTVTDNLFTQGRIIANVVSASFMPYRPGNPATGELTFGGVDLSRFIGPLNFAPVTTTFPSSFYWGIKQSIRYGSSNTIMSNSAGIVDTGTTLLLLATQTFNAYKTATGAVTDTATGLLRLTPAQYTKLQSLFFVIGATTYELTPNAQIWPRSLNTAIGGKSNFVYLAVADLGRNLGSGLDFINGLTFLERFYTVYDTTNKRIGFANTLATRAQTN